MTQDEVLQTLRKVIEEAENFTTWTVSTPHLVELVKRVVEAEREACAKVCEQVAVDYYTRIGREHEPYMRATAEDCARHIRARAQPEERNFCPRCGKRTADLTTIHTCTPPYDNALQRGLARTKEVVAGSQAFYGFPHGPVSTPNAGGKCVTAGETAPKEEKNT